jgi:hypothetical protein
VATGVSSNVGVASVGSAAPVDIHVGAAIVCRAAPGEKVVITCSDLFTEWKKISGDTWKLVVPKAHFGKFNP